MQGNRRPFFVTLSQRSMLLEVIDYTLSPAFPASARRALAAMPRPGASEGDRAGVRGVVVEATL